MPSSLSAPAGPVPGPRPPLVKAAPLARRMAAFAYEGVLLFGVLVITALIYSPSVGQRSGIVMRTGLMAACFFALGIYFIGFWTRSGQTLALKTWHLRVVTAYGRPLTPRRALARYLAAWVWFLPPLFLAGVINARSLALDLILPVAWIAAYALSSRLHPQRQFWHDALCGTSIEDAAPVARR